jgi:hypothetical protein
VSRSSTGLLAAPGSLLVAQLVIGACGADR